MNIDNIMLSQRRQAPDTILYYFIYTQKEQNQQIQRNVEDGRSQGVERKRNREGLMAVCGVSHLEGLKVLELDSDEYCTKMTKLIGDRAWAQPLILRTTRLASPPPTLTGGKASPSPKHRDHCFSKPAVQCVSTHCICAEFCRWKLGGPLVASLFSCLCECS